MLYFKNLDPDVIPASTSNSVVKLNVNIDDGNDTASYTTVLKDGKKIFGVGGNINLQPIGKLSELSKSIVRVTTSVPDLNKNVNKVSLKMLLSGAVQSPVHKGNQNKVQDGDVVVFSYTIIFQ